MNKKCFFAVILVLFTLIFESCYEPSPLYGNWADNDGNKISFILDGSFVATVYNRTLGKNVVYEGNYTVIDNVIVFSYTGDDGSSGSMNTEWDLRGSMMYLYWTTASETKLLTLYHVSK